jgi:hypothetical protein
MMSSAGRLTGYLLSVDRVNRPRIPVRLFWSRQSLDPTWEKSPSNYRSSRRNHDETHIAREQRHTPALPPLAVPPKGIQLFRGNESVPEGTQACRLRSRSCCYARHAPSSRYLPP